MKYLILSLLILLSISASGQTKKTYNTKISKAKNVKITGGKTVINKADSVFIGTVTINQVPKYKLYLLKYNRTKDSTGYYITNYSFGPVEDMGTFNIKLDIKFDKPYIPFNDSFPFYFSVSDAGVSSIASGWNDNFTELLLSGAFSARYLTVTVRSKEPLFASISGVDGKLPSVISHQ